MLAECEFCKEKSEKIKRYEDEIEREKIVHCEMALEREKISKGMQCTKIDEIRLKEMLKRQIEEKKLIEEEKERVEMMWHQLLLDTVKMKEQYERQQAQRLHQEMVERRRFYDEQITSANIKKREAIRQEKEIENNRLERMKQKMEQDYFEEIKRKKEQQQRNKINFIEGHEDKLKRLRSIKKQERELDNETITAAIEEIRREKEKMKNQIHSQRIEEQIFVDNFNRERYIAAGLEQEKENVIIEWDNQKQKDVEEKKVIGELRKAENKKNAVQEYRRHLEQRKQKIERDRQERCARMERVRKTAIAELRRNLENANEEMRRQIHYRNSLTDQIRNNQNVLEAELNSIEDKQRPFTKQAKMFQEAMADKINSSRSSTNPVHPFRRLFQSQSAAIESKLTLPSIHNLKL